VEARWPALRQAEAAECGWRLRKGNMGDVEASCLAAKGVDVKEEPPNRACPGA